jgi:predicted nucleic acid-binding protein
MVARRNWTRDWWDNQRARYELVTSVAVIEELEEGTHPKMREAIGLVASLPLLPIQEDVAEIVDMYISHFVMPSDPRGDALHLALASYHRCHFLLTWNCEHLANANKFEHIRHVNTLLGLPVPTLVTPLELLSSPEAKP